MAGVTQRVGRQYREHRALAFCMWGPWGSYLTDSKEGEVRWEAAEASPEGAARSLTQLC